MTALSDYVVMAFIQSDYGSFEILKRAKIQSTIALRTPHYNRNPNNTDSS